jgi:IS30 family transposase
VGFNPRIQLRSATHQSERRASYGNIMAFRSGKNERHLMEIQPQLTQEERYQIYALLKAGHTQTEIARVIGRDKSTISRELRRNQGKRGYRPKQAQQKAQQRRQEAVRSRITEAQWTRVDELLREDWSPEQVSEWLASEEDLHVSHEWLYQHIYADKRQGGDLYKHLRCQKLRRKRYGSYDRRGQIKDRVSIEERPAVVERRSRIGDWEADTVIGRPGGAVLVTLVERKTRHSVFVLAPDKSAEAVKEAIVNALQPLAAQVKTITYDNGKEFAYHTAVAEALDAKGYFAHPYHSWERGLNENTNGLIRQYLPKGMSFDSLTQADIQRIMIKLNNRPRKCLGYKTPNQVMFGIEPPVALAS